MMQLTRRKLFAGAAAAGAVLAGPSPIVLPARAAAPAAGKQNAGWYRYKVGDFEVTVVTDGMNSEPTFGFLRRERTKARRERGARSRFSREG